MCIPTLIDFRKNDESKVKKMLIFFLRISFVKTLYLINELLGLNGNNMHPYI